MPKFDCLEYSSSAECRDLCNNTIALVMVVLLFSQHKPEVARFVLADDWFLVMARHVMPLDTISIEVVEDGHARLLLPALSVLPVIGLGHTVPASM